MTADAEYWANWFWHHAGGRSSYPADIRYATTCALPVSVMEIADLTTSTAADYFELPQDEHIPSAGERNLHGCIAVRPRGATILVEIHDEDAQKRFTIAHEVAHYIIEVHRHQERAARMMDDGYVEVLYGSRKATPNERIDACLYNVRSSPITHFMDRTPSGEYGCGQTLRAECAADLLATEILAPRATLMDSLSPHRRLPFRQLVDTAIHLSEHRFGLPSAIAESYGNRVIWQWRGGQSISEKFGF